MNIRLTDQTNASAADLEPFANLKTQKNTTNFIAESEKVVVSLLASDLEISSLYLTPEHFNEKRDSIEAHRQESHAQVIIAPKSEMEAIVGYPLHQGIMAAAKIPKEQSLDDLIIRGKKPQLFIILDTIADAENIGALYRTALAMGATAIILDDKSISPWIRRAIRVSMGAVFSLPTVTVSNLTETIEYLNSKDISTFAAEIDGKSKRLYDVNFSSDVAIVFGSEGHGVSREVLNQCSDIIEIPMNEGVKSLNITVAQGMVLYEVVRQRSS